MYTRPSPATPNPSMSPPPPELSYQLIAVGRQLLSSCRAMQPKLATILKGVNLHVSGRQDIGYVLIHQIPLAIRLLEIQLAVGLQYVRLAGSGFQNLRHIHAQNLDIDVVA